MESTSPFAVSAPKITKPDFCFGIAANTMIKLRSINDCSSQPINDRSSQFKSSLARAESP
jgi:hypothetical protein